MEELKEVDTTRPIERCDECGRILNRDPYVFHLPDGKRICFGCLFLHRYHDGCRRAGGGPQQGIP